MKRAALAGAFVLLAAAGTQAQRLDTLDRPSQIAVVSRGDRLYARVWAAGGSADVDTRRLTFSLRPYDRRGDATAERPLDVRVGDAVPDASDGSAPPATQRVLVPFTLRGRPALSGMYELELRGKPGFLRSSIGAATELQGRIAVWWPDDVGADAALRDLRRHLERKPVYGYGVLEAGCPDASVTFYSPTTGVPVRRVVRERGRAIVLGLGARNVTPPAERFPFIAVDPIRADVALDGIPSIGSNTNAEPAVAPCPAIRFADAWHAELLFSTRPPARPPARDPFHLRLGMTRADVVRGVGFPNRYETRAMFMRDAVWDYAAGAPFRFSVRFARDRVAHVDPPVGLP